MDVPEITTDCLDCKPIIDALVEQVKKLTDRLEKVEWEGQRQAAPFRKKRKADSKKAGRKALRG